MKISITSEKSMFKSARYDPNKREVIKQTLNIHDNGKVFWNEYVLAPDLGCTIERHYYKTSEEDANQIIKSILKHFETHIEDFVCDAGMWNVEIMYDNGMKINACGSLSWASPELNKISDKIQNIISNQNIWVFG